VRKADKKCFEVKASVITVNNFSAQTEAMHLRDYKTGHHVTLEIILKSA
jgi:hypothetical protein